MRILFCLTTFLCLLFAGCNEEELVGNPDDFPDGCDYLIGPFSLLPDSRNAAPYGNRHSVTFTDSLGNVQVFSVKTSENTESKGTLFKYNVFEQGDTVRYCYISHMIYHNIRNDSLGINFSVRISASPYYTDPLSEFVADVLHITTWFTKANPGFGYGSYTKTIHQRTYPQITNNNIVVPEFEIFGRIFKNVEHTDYFEPKAFVWYNATEGIVAFRDSNGKMWRFEKFN